MIVGIVTALMILFGGGNVESPYIIPKFDKLITSEISSKEREKEVKDLIKTYKTHWKAFKKYEKGFQKDYKKSYGEMDTDSESLSEQLEQFQLKQEELNGKLIPIRMEVMDLVTHEEWKGAIDHYFQIPEKKKEKKSKKELKAAIKQNKKLSSIRNKIINNLETTEDQNSVYQAFESFESSLTEISYNEQDALKEIIHSIADKEISETELTQLMENYLSFSIELSKAAIDLRENIKGNLTTEDWDKVQKDLLKLID